MQCRLIFLIKFLCIRPRFYIYKYWSINRQRSLQCVLDSLPQLLLTLDKTETQNRVVSSITKAQKIVSMGYEMENYLFYYLVIFYFSFVKGFTYPYIRKCASILNTVPCEMGVRVWVFSQKSWTTLIWYLNIISLSLNFNLRCFHHICIAFWKRNTTYRYNNNV